MADHQWPLLFSFAPDLEPKSQNTIRQDATNATTLALRKATLEAFFERVGLFAFRIHSHPAPSTGPGRTRPDISYNSFAAY